MPSGGASPSLGPTAGGSPPLCSPEDYTQPRQTIQSPDTLYKAKTDHTKHRQTIQSPKTLYEDVEY